MIFSRQVLLGYSITAMRIALGIIFLWFGLLKLQVPGPVFEIIDATFPFFAQGVGNHILMALEVFIGLALIFNILRLLTHTVLVLHLMGTFATFFIAPEMMFDPHFPYLTLAGEFVVKNLALAIGGITVLLGETRS